MVSLAASGVSEADFVKAFDSCRPTLAGFAKCSSLEELRVVRDAFFLNMASKLCPEQYAPVKRAVVESARVAAAAGTAGGIQAMIEAARSAPEWGACVAALMKVAGLVNSDLIAIWQTLETGRLRWLNALGACHKLKTGLRAKLVVDKGTEGDVMDAKMVWVYALGSVLPTCAKEAAAWAAAAEMTDPGVPLQNYRAELWDPRRPEWAPLDRAVTAAAAAGGVNELDEAWLADGLV